MHSHRNPVSAALSAGSLLATVACAAASPAATIPVSYITTTRDMEHTLTSVDPIEFIDSTENVASDGITIKIDEGTTYQTVFGIGSSLESSTCYNLMRMSPEDRQAALARLFDPNEGIGFNLMRITVATSDFCPLPFYSYDDVPEGGEPDVTLSGFSIEKDQEYILPCLRETAKYASAEMDNNLRYFASSWSPPGWMKTSGKLEGGEYDPAYLEQYADYLTLFLDAYEAEGIHISALTPQNEPLQNEDTYPTTYFPAELEAELIGKYLGPKMAEKNSTTDIWCFDHNWNTPKYPKTIFDDNLASQYVAGSAFHNYGGRPTTMTELKEQYPDKDMFFTEGSEFGIRGADGIIEIFRNWGRTYNAWVTMLDDHLQPNAGPFHPVPTMMILDTETLQAKYNFEYYMYGQFSKYICRGAVRVMSEGAEDDSMKHVAFLNPVSDSCAVSGKRVVVVANNNKEASNFKFEWEGMHAEVEVLGASVSSFVW